MKPKIAVVGLVTQNSAIVFVNRQCVVDREDAMPDLWVVLTHEWMSTVVRCTGW